MTAGPGSLREVGEGEDGLNVLDLFSGIGGFSIAFHRLGWRTVAFCERLPDRRWWLRTNFPGIPVYRDISHVTERSVRTLGAVDIVCGGFPCQDISSANTHGAGLDGARSGLAWELIRVIHELGPRWVIVENSPRLRTRGADRLIDALEKDGYACWPLVVGARHLLAPHRRDRVWLVAHSFERQRPGPSHEASGICHNWAEPALGRTGRSTETIAHAAVAGVRQQPRRGGGPDTVPAHHVDTDCEGQSRLPFDGQVGRRPRLEGIDGEPWGWWNDGPGAHLRMDDGLSVSVARQQIAAFGDSVVPAIVEAIGRAILEIERVE